MSDPLRLSELLPAIHRQRDAIPQLRDGALQGYGRGPLESLLDLIDEQVDAVRRDIARLYENWFVETAEEWVLPDLAELIGVTPVGEPTADAVSTITRADVANTIRNRRRKGTLAVLEQIAADIAGWPAAAVEYARIVVATPSLRHVPAEEPGTADLRHLGSHHPIGGPFDRVGRLADLRWTQSPTGSGGRGNWGVGLHVWRIPAAHHDAARAGRREESDPQGFSLSLLGHDVRAVVRPTPSPNRLAGPLHVPTSITRRWLESDLAGPRDLYRRDGSLHVRRQVGDDPPIDVDPESLVVADLTEWRYKPEPDQIAIDPELGRLIVGTDVDADTLVVRYSTLADAIGAQPHPRPALQRHGCTDRPASLTDREELLGHDCLRYRVRADGAGDAFTSLVAALDRWVDDADALAGAGHEVDNDGQGDEAADGARDSGLPARVVFEIAGTDAYDAPASFTVPSGVRMEFVGVEGTPLLWRADLSPARPDALVVSGGGPASCLVFDNLLVAGRGLVIRGDLAGFVLRRSTLVPGWLVDGHCEPIRPGEASVVVVEGEPCIRIEHSVLGPVEIEVSAVSHDPLSIEVSDSIVDGGRSDAISADDGRLGHARLTMRRSTVLGRVSVHEVDLVEDSIVTDGLDVARRQTGCVRFSYFPLGCRPPRRFSTQPDLALRGVTDDVARRWITATVRPIFVSERYGRPGYGRLAPCTPDEIHRGACDGGEMGAFNELHEPLRIDQLRRRLAEYSTRGTTIDLHFADLEEQ